jgi:hypothetical protein
MALHTLVKRYFFGRARFLEKADPEPRRSFEMINEIIRIRSILAIGLEASIWARPGPIG